MPKIARITYWWTLLTLLVPNVAFCFTEHCTLLQSVAGVVLPGGVLWLLLSMTRRVGWSVWGVFFFMFMSAFQIVLLSLYGGSVIAVDMFLNVATTTLSEAGELLEDMLPALIVVCLLYLPPLVMAGVCLYRHYELSSDFIRHNRAIGRLTTLLGCTLLGLCLVSTTPYRPLRQLYPLNAFYNLMLAVDRVEKQAGYADTSRGFGFGIEPTDTAGVLTVIVVGETSRASEWQLYGYGRPTNPRLSGRSGLTAFPRALSQSNTTHKSVPLMLSHIGVREFDDSIYSVKSVIAAFGEAGIPTAFISAQGRNGALIDAFGSEADTCVFLADSLGPRRTDLDILPLFDRVTASLGAGDRMLVVLHTYGSHYRYNDRYPAEMARFKPDAPLEAEKSCRPTLINAYDNTIVLTDRLLAEIMDRIDGRGLSGALIYTSDHGEDIFDDRRGRFLHASPIPTYEQLHVPMLVWMSSAYRSGHPQMYLAAVANRRRPVATSESVFPTAMMLAGLRSSRSDETLSLVSNRYTPKPYVYLDDHNEAVTPEAIGMNRADIARIDSLYTAHLHP